MIDYLIKLLNYSPIGYLLIYYKSIILKLIEYSPIGYFIIRNNSLMIKLLSYTPLGLVFSKLSLITQNKPSTNDVINKVMTDNKFDNNKFNLYYDEMKKKQREEGIKRENDRLKELENSNNENPETDDIDSDPGFFKKYNNNMNDIITGNDWTGEDKQLYIGITIIVIALFGYFLIDVYDGYIKN